MTNLCAVIADTHFGEKGNSKEVLDNQSKFWSKVFFPTIEERGITDVLHVGDVFHDRRKIDMYTAERARQMFFEPMQDHGCDLDIIAGNHDLYYKDSSNTGALNEIVSFYDFVNVHTEPGITRSGLHVVPWINQQNREKAIDFITHGYKTKDLFGHLELVGFKQYRNSVSVKGDDPSLFKKWRHVYSGHYHHKNTIGNITYLGSTGQYTWADDGDTRGFHIYDRDTGDMEFIPNPYNLFEVITYPPQKGVKLDVKGKFIKIRHGIIDSPSKFKDFVNSLERDAIKILFQPDKSTLIEGKETKPDGVDITEIETTPEMIRLLVEEDDVSTYMIELYNRASHVS